jgi:tetratricopeptide (TPR) repeat protein
MFGRKLYIVAVVLALAGASHFLRRSATEAVRRAPADIEHRIAMLEQRAAKMGGDPDVLSDLAGAYMRKARALGQQEWYARAEETVRRALAVRPDHYAATKMMAWVLAGYHRFAESIEWAKKAQAMQPNDAWNYGTLGDAYVETGEYDAAAEAYQKMVELRPDVASYSRAAHLRELMGDRAGAIEIMQLAVRSASPRDAENYAWTLTQLGNMYFHGGNLAAAQSAFDNALRAWPDSHLALVGRARVCVAAKRASEAVPLLERAAGYPDAHILLGDIYSSRREAAAAERQYAHAEKLLLDIGDSARHELATFYADHGRNIAQAVAWMKDDLRSARDIAAFDTMAWAAFKAGRIEEARAAIEQALRLGTQDARLFHHAGMIYQAAGDAAKGAEYLRRARQVNPYFSAV